MSEIIAKDIITELKDLWPKLVDVWLADKNFYSPAYSELQEAIIEIDKARKIIKEALAAEGIILNCVYADEVHDCDNFSLELHADISRYRMSTRLGYPIIPGLRPWAFGLVMLMKVKGRDLNHTINICRTSDKGFVFIEPQDNTMWIADKDRDTPYYMDMR